MKKKTFMVQTVIVSNDAKLLFFSISNAIKQNSSVYQRTLLPVSS